MQFIVLLLALSSAVAQESRNQLFDHLTQIRTEPAVSPSSPKPLQNVNFGTTKSGLVFNTAKIIRLPEDRKPQKRQLGADLRNAGTLSLPALGSATVASLVPVKPAESATSNVEIFAKPTDFAPRRDSDFAATYFQYGYHGAKQHDHHHGHKHHHGHHHKHKNDHKEHHKEKHKHGLYIFRI